MQAPHGKIAGSFRPVVAGRNGMVAAGHPLAAEAGVRTLATVLEPAIGLAEEGFPISPKLAEGIAGCGGPLTSFPSSAAVYAPEGRPLRAGERLVQRDLGRSLRRLAAEGGELFYRGELARAMARISRELDGFLDEADLAAFHARWQEPIQVSYHGHE